MTYRYLSTVESDMMAFLMQDVCQLSWRDREFKITGMQKLRCVDSCVQMGYPQNWSMLQVAGDLWYLVDS